MEIEAALSWYRVCAAAILQIREKVKGGITPPGPAACFGLQENKTWWENEMSGSLFTLKDAAPGKRLDTFSY